MSIGTKLKMVSNQRMNERLNRYRKQHMISLKRSEKVSVVQQIGTIKKKSEIVHSTVCVFFLCTFIRFEISIDIILQCGIL